MILHLILQQGKKFEEEHDLGKRRENPYHNENRYIRTQLYSKNYDAFMFPDIDFSKFPVHLWESSLLCGLKWGRNQCVSIETVSTTVNFGPLFCQQGQSHCP